MSERIYRLDGDGAPRPLEETPFPREADIQRLIAAHPEVLAGEAMTPAEPRRWLLVGVEVPVPDAAGGARWFLDVLLLDQDARPTLVEVKRGANPEVRREVLGQMLDYVAHAERYWPVGTLRERCEAAHEGREGGFEGALAALLGEDEPDADAFWERVDANLRAANLRLLFAADGIPDELARVVEFLNAQMATVEVLAVDIRRFAGGDAATLVPRVIGRTARAGRASRSGPTKSRDEWLADMPEGAVRDAARVLLERAVAAGGVVRPTFGGGGEGLLIRAPCAFRSSPVTVALLWPSRATSDGPRFEFGSNSAQPLMRAFPPDVRDALDAYVGEFEADPFEKRNLTRGDPPHQIGWAVGPEDAAANVELLAARVEAIIRRLAPL